MKENGVEKIKIVLDRKDYEIGRFFNLEQLKRLAGVDNDKYGICLIVPYQSERIFIGNQSFFRADHDYEMRPKEYHDGIFLKEKIGVETLQFFSYGKTITE